MLINPAEAVIAATNLQGVETAANATGLKIEVLNASTSSEIDAAFATYVRERFDAFFIASGVFFLARRTQLATLAIGHGVPTIFAGREWAEAGGLASYGTNFIDMTVCRSPLSRSLLGVMRTSLFAAHMSAYDPKRTFAAVLEK